MINHFRKWIKSKFWRKTFFGIYLSYILVISIAVLIIGTLIISIISRKYYQETYDLNIKMLNQRISLYEQILLRKPGDILLQLALSNIKYRYLENNNPRDNILIVKDLIDDLSSIKNMSSYIQSIYIFIGKYRTIISTDGYTVLDQNMKTDLSVIESYNINWLKNSIQSDIGNIFRITSLNMNNNEEDGSGELNNIAYAMRINNNHRTNNTVMAVIMNENKIHEAIYDKNRKSNILILNNDGKVLTCNNISYKKIKLDNEFQDKNVPSDGYMILRNADEKYFVCYTTSIYNRMQYITWTPYDEIFQSMYVTQRIIFIICVLVWMACIFVSYIFSKKQYRKLSNVVEFISVYFPDLAERIGKEDEYTLIKITTKACVNRMNIMKKEIFQNNIILRNDTLRSLVLGEWTDILEFENLLRSHNITFPNNYTYVITTKLKGFHESKALLEFEKKESFIKKYKELLENCFQKHMDGNIYSIWLGNDNLVFIINSSHEHFIEKVMEEAGKQMSCCYDINMITGVNRGGTDIAKIPMLFQGAVTAINQDYFCDYQANNIYYYYKLSDDINSCINELEIYEKSIIKFFNAKEIDESIKCFDEIFKIAVKNRIFSDMVKNIIFEIVLKCISGLKQNNAVVYMNFINKRNIKSELDNLKNTHEFKIWLASNIVNLKTICDNEKNDRKIDVINKVKEILEKQDLEDISLENMSELLYLHPDYLRHIFKNITGITYYEYTRMIKMKRAKDLLLETDLKITEISKKLNYLTVPYFIKVFKETYGITPNDYRSKNRN